MTRTREDWWQRVAERRDDHLIKLLKANLPYAEHKRALLEHAEELMREAKSPSERRRLQRLTRARQAFAMLEEVEGMLKRIRKSHYLRREGMQGTAHARAVAAAAGITLPDDSR